MADAQLPAQQPLAENPENQAALAAAPEEDFSAGWRGQQLPPLPYHLLENEGALDLPASGGLPFPTKARVKSARNKRYSPWRVGASLTASTEHFNAANSASLGGVLDWQPKRSHWGLRSGLAYEHYRPSGFARPIAEVNADRYADATRNYAFLFNNGVYVPGTSEALGLDVALPVVLMQRLRVPLLVYWQPARWLRCYGGGSFSYTLRAHTLREGLAFDEELVGARSASSAARVNKLATQELPRFNAQIQSGLGLRLGKRWEIEMNYRQSAKIQFKSLFEKRVEEGQPVSHVPTFRRPNHHFVSVSGIYFFGK
ncbi:MAG TPA: hypothetical protein PKD78_13425 [Saprospiraceae bacterium]|nr:hypothetical protein [Saprospiraceae bacterium]